MASAVQLLAQSKSRTSRDAFLRTAWHEARIGSQTEQDNGLLGRLRSTISVTTSKLGASRGPRPATKRSQAAPQAIASKSALIELSSGKWATLPEDLLADIFDCLLRSLSTWERWEARVHVIAALNHYWHKWAVHHSDAGTIVSTTDPQEDISPNVQALRVRFDDMNTYQNFVPLTGSPRLRSLSLEWDGWLWPIFVASDENEDDPALLKTPTILGHLVALSLSVRVDHDAPDWLFNGLSLCKCLKELRLYKLRNPACQQRLPPDAAINNRTAPFSLNLFVLRGDFSNYITDDLVVWMLSGTEKGGCRVVSSDFKWPYGCITNMGVQPPIHAAASAAIKELSLIAMSMSWSFHPWLWPELSQLRTLRVFQVVVPSSNTVWQILACFPLLETLSIGLMGDGRPYEDPPLPTVDNFVEGFGQRSESTSCSLRRLEIDDDASMWSKRQKRALLKAVEKVGVEVVWRPLGSALASEFESAMWEMDGLASA